MTHRRKDTLRSLTDEERDVLEQISRSYSEPASHVARSKIILAVADGETYAKAAQAAGRKAREPVSELISRFNQEGIAAIEPRHGGGPASTYGAAERERILAEMRRSPDPEQDGTKNLVLNDSAACPTAGTRRATAGEHTYDLARSARSRMELAKEPQLV